LVQNFNVALELTYDRLCLLAWSYGDTNLLSAA